MMEIIFGAFAFWFVWSMLGALKELRRPLPPPTVTIRVIERGDDRPPPQPRKPRKPPKHEPEVLRAMERNARK
jgi:hypothetical protein